MSEPVVLVERRDPVAIVTLNRPGARNAIDDELRGSLSAAFTELSADPAVSVVVVTGAGTAFCAGGDIKGMKARLERPAGRVAIDGWTRQQHTAAFIRTVHEARPITIAAVNGPAMGLGMDVALACDFIVAGPDAAFGSSFVKRGLIADGGSLYFLPRRIGLQRARELLFSGRTVSGAEALEIGLADRVAGTDLLPAALDFANEFTGNSPSALALMKSILGRTFESTLDEIARLGGAAQAISYTTDEHRAAVERFLDR